MLILSIALMAPSFAGKAADSSSDIPLASGQLLGSGPDRLVLGLGAFNVIPNEDKGEIGYADTSFEVRGEYYFGDKWYSLGPVIGIMANTDGGVFGYGAIYSDLAFGNWVFTPTFGIGGYAQNDSKDLGGVFQFQLSLEAAYQFDEGSRLGLRLSHISNAGINEHNTGVESALVTYSIPLGY